MSLAVVHLASGSLGVEPLRRFVASYRAHDAGIEHELVVVMQRFEAGDEGAGHREVLGDVPHRLLRCDDYEQDLAAYVFAAHRLDSESLCFLNANSEILAAGWLATLAAVAGQDGVGMVGATGTYESHVTGARSGGDLGRGVLSDARTRAARLVGGMLTRRTFPAFPNPHLRTNAMLLHAETMRRLVPAVPARQRESHALESGRRSLTRRIQGEGGSVLVVGRDGVGYPPERWRESHTFRSGDQQNLLVGDRRTRQYAEAGADLRAELERLAWGAAGP